MTRGDFATVEEVAPSPMEAAKRFVAEGAEWIHIVDLDGARGPRVRRRPHLLRRRRLGRRRHGAREAQAPRSPRRHRRARDLPRPVHARAGHRRGPGLMLATRAPLTVDLPLDPNTIVVT